MAVDSFVWQRTHAALVSMYNDIVMYLCAYSIYNVKPPPGTLNGRFSYEFLGSAGVGGDMVMGT